MARATQTQRQFIVKSPLGADAILLREMKGSEEMGRLSDFQLELLSEDDAINMPDILGQSVTVEIELPRGGSRFFNGICTQFSQVGQEGGFICYRAQLRPWLWLLTQAGDCRIFQEMTVPDVIKQVFRDHGFSDFEDKLSRSYRTWEYLVQYRESTFNFVSRLMEQEGIYYFFKHQDGKHVLMLSDDYSSHEPFPNYDTVKYYPPDEARVREEDHISEWELAQEIRTCKYTIDNYDFKRPQTELRTQTSQTRQHAHADLEYYDFFGEYLETGDGDQYVKNRLQEQQARYEVVRGSGDCRGIASGSLFTLDGQTRDDQNREYLVTSCTWHLEQNLAETGSGGPADEFSCALTAIESTTPFRPARITPKPPAYGPHTAVVVGPSGEEIWTDEHGRVKVQFHWDRDGSFDENSTCWVRVQQVMAGNAWGTIWLPRISHEVVVEFIEGDPDRPLVVGSVYNGDNKVPYTLPDNKTQSGVKTRSTKSGDTSTFNELRFEDKKGEEQIYFHAEKNFDRVVENNDTLKVGFDDKDKGDQKIEIYNDREIIIGNNEKRQIGFGDDLEPGDQEVVIYHDQTVGIGNNEIRLIGFGDSPDPGDQDIEVYNDRIVKIGNNDTLTVEKGDQTIDVKLGKTEHKAMNSIELKVGSSSIKLTQQDITIKAPMITIKADATLDVKSPMTTVKGDAMLTLKGGITMIN